MFKLAAIATTSFVAATPEEGCYFYAVPVQFGLDIKAQVNVKSASTLEFSVFFNVPEMGLSKKALVCEDEPYEWNATTSAMRVGTTLSTCLTTLVAMTPEGVISYPIDLTYSPSESSLSTVIAVPVVLAKTATCEYFGPGIPYSRVGDKVTTVAPTDMLVASTSAITPKSTMTVVSFVSALAILTAAML